MDLDRDEPLCNDQCFHQIPEKKKRYEKWLTIRHKPHLVQDNEWLHNSLSTRSLRSNCRKLKVTKR